MKEFAKVLGLKLGAVLLAYGASRAIENKLDGKTIFGNEKKEKIPKKTRVDWRGNVYLGTNDYVVT